MAAPVPSHTAPILPLDALPDENPNTPLAPVVPAFTDRSTALPLLVAVPSPKPNDKAPTVFTVLPPAMAPMLLPAPLVLLPTVGEIDLPRPSMAAPVPSHTAPMLPLDTLPDENSNTPLAPMVPVVAVPSPKPTNKAPTMLTSLPPAMASMLLPAPLVLLPTVKEINQTRRGLPWLHPCQAAAFAARRAAR